MNIPSARLQRTALVAGLLAGITAPALAQGTMYTTLGPAFTFQTNNFVQFGGGAPGAGYADRFLNPVSASVGSVSLALQAVNPGTTLTVTIRSNSVNGPDGIVGHFNSVTLPTDPEVVTFTASSPFQLDAGVRYWVTATGATGQVDWFRNDQNIDNFTAFGLGGTWTVEQVAGTGLAIDVEAVPEPSTLALSALGLAGCVAVVGHGRRGIAEL